ncbi:PKD domain-containing protein, partial [Polluticaenibacter yanchengensis]|nr:PKD domain-containing protein [Chitinophagaceae bacterium LY-5]MDA3616900.1 PKD domain-containing protein [Chitinophagaceae bacterium LY-5]
FKLSDKPTTPDFDITAVNTCVGTEISFTEKGNEAGVKTWYWNLGDGNPLNLTTNGTSVKKTYTTAGEYTIKHVVKFSDNCISDTAFGKITVFATPVVDFTNDAGSCIDESGLVNFVPTVSSSDNQAVASYAWNFGDANANTGNPNTSTAANPSHSFAPGKYKVQLIVTTVNGCTNQIEKEINLSGKPKLSFN